jgi:hypothetical protein
MSEVVAERGKAVIGHDDAAPGCQARIRPGERRRDPPGLQVPRGACLTGGVHFNAITVYGVCVLTIMMVTYMLERRHRFFVVAFALGCLLSSLYGFLSGAWPFGVVEAIWSVAAIVRFRHPPVSATR